MIALLACLQAHLGFERLAVGSSLRAVLDAVVDRIANQVNDRIGKILDHGLVDLGILAGEDQLHVLAQAAGEVPRDARVLLEQAPDRLHPGLHDCVLQVGYQQVELTHRYIEGMDGFGICLAVQDVAAQGIEAVLRQPDLARQIEHLIESRGIDADGILAALLRIATTDRARVAGFVGGTASHRRLDDLLGRLARHVGMHLHLEGWLLRCRRKGGAGDDGMELVPVGSAAGIEQLAEIRRRGPLPTFIVRCPFQLPGDRPFQPVDQFGLRGRRLAPRFEAAEHLAHDPGGGKNHVHGLGRDLEFAVTQLIE